MQPSQARKLLLHQHDELRRAFDDALRICDLVTSSGAASATASATSLWAAVERVGDLFALHNATEEVLLEPLLREDYAWGHARIGRMLEEHKAEHAEMRAALRPDADLTGAAARVRDAIEMMDAHMAAEERTFLAPSVLRDSVVQVDDAG
jgi:hypothetical protein